MQPAIVPLSRRTARDEHCTPRINGPETSPTPLRRACRWLLNDTFQQERDFGIPLSLELNVAPCPAAISVSFLGEKTSTKDDVP